MPENFGEIQMEGRERTLWLSQGILKKFTVHPIQKGWKAKSSAGADAGRLKSVVSGNFTVNTKCQPINIRTDMGRP